MPKYLKKIIMAMTIVGWTGGAAALPITDTVMVNGHEWAQVNLFSNVSWGAMNSVCSGGICNGQLNGYDMTGWLWADTAAVTDLFNYYIGSPVLGISNGMYQQTPSVFAAKFFADGWKPTERPLPGSNLTTGLVSESGSYMAYIGDSGPILNMSEAFIYRAYPSQYFRVVGGWFVRAPDVGVPAPATLSLAFVGLALLAFGRRSTAGGK